MSRRASSADGVIQMPVHAAWLLLLAMVFAARPLAAQQAPADTAGLARAVVDDLRESLFGPMGNSDSKPRSWNYAHTALDSAVAAIITVDPTLRFGGLGGRSTGLSIHVSIPHAEVSADGVARVLVRVYQQNRKHDDLRFYLIFKRTPEGWRLSERVPADHAGDKPTAETRSSG